MKTDYLVGDFMTIDPIVTSPSVSLDSAMRMLASYEVSGLPVVDDRGRLVGVLSQTDLLAGGHLANLQVRDRMSSPPVTVRIETPMCEAARVMRDRGIHRVVVIDDEDRPVGVLSSMDFVTLYAEG